jgi:hypothetical protein
LITTWRGLARICNGYLMLAVGAVAGILLGSAIGSLYLANDSWWALVTVLYGP